jgi:hypothetical protein
MIVEEPLTTLVAECARGKSARCLPARRELGTPPVAPAAPAHGTDSLVARLVAAADELAASAPELDASSWAQFDAALRSLHGAMAAIRALEWAAPSRVAPDENPVFRLPLPTPRVLLGERPGRARQPW